MSVFYGTHELLVTMRRACVFFGVDPGSRDVTSISHLLLRVRKNKEAPPRKPR